MMKMEKLPANNLIQYPGGRWGFVGRVNARLAYTRKDGSLLTDEDVKTLATCQSPGLLFKCRSFATAEEAQKALDSSV
jgi:hypothetical protein